jgi:multidrug efflux pump subunit AcrB
MKPIIAWFVDNRVAANLLMWILVVGGLVSLPKILVEEFPSIDPRMVRVDIPYPGASPEEVEQGVCKRVEEVIDGITGIKKINTSAYEGHCGISIELENHANATKVSSDIEGKVNSITSFPKETEKPIVAEVTIEATVMQIALAGDISDRAMKELGESIRDDLTQMDSVSLVALKFVKPYEISVEVSEQTLRQYQLSITTVADAIRRFSIDIPGGTIKTADGEVTLRTLGQGYIAEDFEDIVVLARADGSNVTLGEIATIRDSFREQDLDLRMNGQKAIIIRVSRHGSENLLQIGEEVKAYLAAKQSSLPAGVSLKIWKDESQDLIDRLDVLARNASGGLFLVLIILALFLKPRLAFWVSVGLPIALMGTLLLFPVFNISINSITIMAFILVLGILVDDAIVVGERIHAHELRGYKLRDAAVLGTQEITTPVIFGVLTTMAAFMPLLMMTSGMASFFQTIGATAMVALFFSVVESQLILPAHLAHRHHKASDKPSRWEHFQEGIASRLRHFATDRYRPALQRVLAWRYLTVTVAVSVIILTASLFISGRMVFQFFPSVEDDRIYASLTMPAGTPMAVTEDALNQMLAAAETLREEIDSGNAADQPSNIVRIMRAIGNRVQRGSMGGDSNSPSAHIGEIVIELRPFKARTTDMLPTEIARRWRELTGPIVDAVAVQYTADFFSAGDPIAIRLRGDDTEELRAATAVLKEALSHFDGVADINDSFRSGKQEVQFALREEAKALGFSTASLGEQIRQAFYGDEAQRVQRGKEDVRVMVRYPEVERQSLNDLENMHVRTPEGDLVPFGNVADMKMGFGFASIKRLDGERVITVTADVDRSVIEPEKILAALDATVRPELATQFPGVEYSLGGEAEESFGSMNDLKNFALLALLIIYALLAIPLHSYTQPLVIMAVIPFGAVGAVLGHIIVQKDLVFFSLLGIVALSGVVVNASLVMVDYINKQRAKGEPLMDAITNAGVERFRPIVLTSATTFFGLIPLIMNHNPTTMIFTPMAVSLAFGVLFATSITLFLVPSLYLILNDFGLDKRA